MAHSGREVSTESGRFTTSRGRRVAADSACACWQGGHHVARQVQGCTGPTIDVAGASLPRPRVAADSACPCGPKKSLRNPAAQGMARASLRAKRRNLVVSARPIGNVGRASLLARLVRMQGGVRASPAPGRDAGGYGLEADETSEIAAGPAPKGAALRMPAGGGSHRTAGRGQEVTAITGRCSGASPRTLHGGARAGSPDHAGQIHRLC